MEVFCLFCFVLEIQAEKLSQIYFRTSSKTKVSRGVGIVKRKENADKYLPKNRILDGWLSHSVGVAGWILIYIWLPGTLVKLAPTADKKQINCQNISEWHALPPVTSNQQYRWMVVHALFIASNVSHFMTYSTELLWVATWCCQWKTPDCVCHY